MTLIAAKHLKFCQASSTWPLWYLSAILSPEAHDPVKQAIMVVVTVVVVTVVVVTVVVVTVAVVAVVVVVVVVMVVTVVVMTVVVTVMVTVMVVVMVLMIIVVIVVNKALSTGTTLNQPPATRLGSTHSHGLRLQAPLKVPKTLLATAPPG